MTKHSSKDHNSEIIYFNTIEELLASPTTDSAPDSQYLQPADRISELYDDIYHQVAWAGRVLSRKYQLDGFLDSANMIELKQP